VPALATPLPFPCVGTCDSFGAVPRVDRSPESRVDEPYDIDPRLDETIALVESAHQWARATAHELRRVAPSAAQGALTGFMVGGPAGAAVGALAGGAGRGPAQDLGAPAAPGIQNAAAVQLLGALLRPETIDALGALALGHAGNPTVPVLGTRVPVAAFANLIAALATQAAVRHHQTMSSVRAPSHHATRPPTAAPEKRAEALLALLAEAATDDDGRDISTCCSDDYATERDLADLDRLEAE